MQNIILYLSNIEDDYRLQTIKRHEHTRHELNLTHDILDRSCTVKIMEVINTMTYVVLITSIVKTSDFSRQYPFYSDNVTSFRLGLSSSMIAATFFIC